MKALAVLLTTIILGACGSRGDSKGTSAVTAESAVVPAATTAVTESARASTQPAPAVGSVQVDYFDPSRPTPSRGTDSGHPGRTLTTEVRFPANADLTPVPGPHPLVVFAHGNASSASVFADLLDDIARAGFVVAAPEMPGESTALPGPPVESDLAEEPCDLIFIADAVRNGPPPVVQGFVSPGPVGLAGQSDGATAAAFAAYSPLSCGATDVGAVVALSANDVPLAASRSAPSPTLLAVTGTADEVNPPSHTRALWSHVPAPAWLLTVDGGNHLSTFTTDTDRAGIDDVITEVLRLSLGADPDAGARLARLGGGRLHLQSR